MNSPRTPEELLRAWMEPMTTGSAKSMRDFLNEAYLRGRQDQNEEDKTEIDDTTDELIDMIQEAIGNFKQNK